MSRRIPYTLTATRTIIARLVAGKITQEQAAREAGCNSEAWRQRWYKYATPAQRDAREKYLASCRGCRSGYRKHAIPLPDQIASRAAQIKAEEIQRHAEPVPVSAAWHRAVRLAVSQR